MSIKLIESSNDVKKAFNEIKQHIQNNEETVKGEKEATVILSISREVYELRSSNLTYNEKIEFAFQCDSNSMTQLFQVA